MNLETLISGELWQALRTRWENRDYSGAVLDAMYRLSDVIREKGDLEGDGVSLVGQAFGGSNPPIKLTKLRTTTDRNIQSGTEAILRGLYQAIRNPRSHEKIRDAEEDAFAIIVFLDYMLRVLGEARAVFSEQAFMDRVFDDDFVAEDRYAELLVEQIPSGKRLSTALEIFRQRGHGNGKHLHMLFDELLPLLTEDDERDFFLEVTDDLADQPDERLIRLAIQVLPAQKWKQVGEVARLRIENKFLKSLRSGRFESRTGQCSAGSFGTWGCEVLEQSILLDRAKSSLIKKLRSMDKDERAYVLKFFFDWLCQLPEMPSQSLESAVKHRLSKGDEDVKSSASVQYMFSDNRSWSDDVQEAIANFAPTPLSEPDDDLPF